MILSFGGKMRDCGRKGWVIRRKWVQPVGVDRLVDALGEAQMRDPLGKPPSDRYDQGGSIQGE
jgi:hypothetical protein